MSQGLEHIFDQPTHSGLKGGRTNRLETFHSNFFVGGQAKSTLFETTFQGKIPVTCPYKGVCAITKLKNVKNVTS